MASRKQQILSELLYRGLLALRAMAGGPQSRWWQREQRRAEVRLAFEEANFLHRVPFSIPDPDYVDNDISFINFAFPVHLTVLGGRLDRRTARLMIEFYELVPAARRGELTWHPDADLRRLAEEDFGR